MSADDDSSDLSSLSSLSPAPSDIELDAPADLETPKPKSKPKKGIQKYFSTVAEQPPEEPTPPPRKRSPSPPHEYVLADNPDIAFIVMFRSRFHDAFPKSLAHFGPQELERDVVEAIPGDRVEHFLCALLGLLLNRKQDVKPGHYGRALEDAISTHKNQWAPAWEDKNPLSGGATFTSMNPTQRLTLLRTLILWTLSSSETVKGLINQSYKQNRHEDDANQPRSVQPWGSDGDKRRYFLIEGQDDTAFRIYRESNPAGTKRTWWSVAGTIDELKALAEKLETKDGGPKAKKLAQKMISAVPRFEAGEEKRKRREYRQMRKEQFKRPEPGFSLYEGRTRGKKMKYTYSDDEDIFSDSTTRRSARNTGTHTPVETGPVTTSSGRQIRAPTRLNPATGSSAPGSVQGDTSEVDKESSVGPTGRPRRSAAVNYGTSGWAGTSNGSRRNTADDSENETEAEFGDDEEDVDEHVPEESEDEDEFDEDEAMVDDDLDDSGRSLVVKLSVTPPKLRNVLAPNPHASNKLPTPSSERGGDKAEASEASEAPLVEMEDAPATEPETKKAAGKEVESAARVSPAPDTKFTERQAATPASIHATPLAFRGSPEKPHVQPVPRPLDIGTSRE